MLVVLRQRNFACLLTAGFISGLGDVVLLIALPFYVYSATGSTLASGGMMIAGTIPRVLFGSVAGVFVDRWERRRTMIAADCARAVILLPLLTVGSGGSLWLIYLVAFLQSSFSIFFTPAREALIPNLVGPEDLIAANALDAQSGSLSGLIGPSLGGALLVLLGLPGVVLADSASFLFSALLLALISLPARPRDHATTNSGGTPALVDPIGRLPRVWREWRDVLRLMRSDRVLGAVLIVFGAIGFGDGVANVLYVPFVRDVLHGGPVEWGWLATASSAAALAGTFIIGVLGRMVRPAGLIVIGVWAAAGYILIMTHVPVLGAIIITSVFTTPLVLGINIGGSALVQGRTPDAFRGRVFGTLGGTIGLAMLCGMGLSSSLGTTLGPIPILNAAAVLYLLSGIVALLVLRGGAPAMEKSVVEVG